MNKKSQITPFIVIGVIILIGSSLFLYYRNFVVVEPEIIPEDLVPIKNYIESCLNDVGEDAVIALGMQSGYIEIPDKIRLGRAYLETIPGSLIKIPYWHYNGINLIPSIEYMELQISNYVENNIENCADLEVFEYDYKIEKSDLIEIETLIAEKDVILTMNYKILVKDKATDEQTKISKFRTNIDVKLKKVYELGKKIMEAENNKFYFENITIDWISMNPNIPLNGIEFHCQDLKWRVRDIKRELQDMIYYSLPKIKVKNTNHPDFLEDEEVYENLKKYTMEDIYNGNLPDIKAPEDAYDYSHYLIDARTEKTDLKVAFVYNQNWDMDLTARPSNQGIMRSIKQSASQEFLSFMCLNTYHFTYDIVYPIEVLIRDDESLNGEGYVFRYSFPVMINHNQADRGGFLNPEFIMLGGQFTGECDSLSGETYDIRVLGLDEYGITNMELQDVNITYDCFKFKCNLGKTDIDEGAYRLRTKLPDSCSNGFINAEKQGYLVARQQVLDETDIDISMNKLKSFEIDVVMNEYNSINGQFSEDILIEEPFSANIEFQSYDDPSLLFFRRYPLPENTKDKGIDLIMQNSRYKVDITLFDEADSVLIGGYKGDLELSYSEIARGEKIVFHVASYIPKPLNKESEKNVFEFLEDNEDYKNRLKPEIR